MLKLLFNWIFRLFRSITSQKTAIDELYKFEFVDDVPDQPQFKTVYFVGEKKYYWQSIMLCPCGCKSLLYMNLMQDMNPYWTFKIDKNKISLSPSVDRFVGCKSHFFLKDGKIIWA